MAKYLDYAGLQYLWAKIKNYVSTQPLGANVRYDQQTLTTAQQEQARANIKAGGSNRNLLDNGWFIVNQRQLTSGTQATMPADRWRATYGSGSVNWSRESDGCITFAPTNTASHGDIYQQIPDEIYDALAGGDKTVTVSVMLQDGTIYSGTSYLPTASTRTYFVVDNVGGTSTRLVAYAQASNKQLFVQAFYGSLTVKAVKLEKGSVSTLANDVPPDYDEELARCIYSTADTTDSYYANNGYGRSNRNLLMNAWFTVNQRSITSGANESATAVYTRDRWKIARCSSYTFNDNSCSVTTSWDGTGSGCYLIQYGLQDGAVQYRGRIVTISGFVDGTFYKKTFTMPAQNSANVTFVLGGGLTVNVVDIIASGRGFEFQFYHSSTTGTRIGPLKLELGTIPTLVSDLPPEYGEELAKCQRYFQRIYAPANMCPFAYGRAVSTTNIYATVPLPVTLRTSPTVSATNVGVLVALGVGTTRTITSVSYAGRFDGGVCLNFASSGSLTANQVYVIAREGVSDVYIDLSADL